MTVATPVFTLERVRGYRLHLVNDPMPAYWLAAGTPSLCGYKPSGGWVRPDTRLKLQANCKRCLHVNVTHLEQV